MPIGKRAAAESAVVDVLGGTADRRRAWRWNLQYVVRRIATVLQRICATEGLLATSGLSQSNHY
jgi:hypothetical protein